MKQPSRDGESLWRSGLVRRSAAGLLFFAALLLNGCIMIGGWDDDRPKPRAAWDGPTSGVVSPSTRPVPGDAEDPESTVALTAAPPEQVVAAARAVLEPAYGPMKYVRREIPNGRTLHLLLTPRYGVSNRGKDYRWVEVSVSFHPDDGRSIVEVEEVEWAASKPLAASLHGGVWLFPPAMVSDNKGVPQHRVLVAILQNLDDPGARVTNWREISVVLE